jgi:hypothetical protein
MVATLWVASAILFEALPIRRRWPATALSVLFAALLAWQLLLPHFIGLANNGDFGKVAGWLALAPPDSWAGNFLYFEADYIRSQRNYWESPYYSSETVLAWLAARLSHATAEGAHFDIRALGAIHAALCTLAFVVLLVSLRRASAWGQCAVAGVAVLAFTDVCYVACLNSFYMDAAALAGLLLLVATAAWIAVTAQPSAGQFLLFGLAGLIYLTSKTQHAIWALLPAAFVAAQSLRARQALGFVVTAILIAGGGLELATAEPSNRAQALFSKIFFQIGTAGPTARADLRELGVQPEELRYIGTHSYMPGSPALNRQWVEKFYVRTGYGRLLVWYLRHPARAARILRDTLTIDAPAMRSGNLSNYRRQEGHPAGARTHRLALWSGLRSAWLARWPYHIVVWYALFSAGAIATIRGRAHAPPARVARRVAALALGVAALGIGQFLVASLADCLETGRHLFLFHVCTDLTVCFAAARAVFFVGKIVNPPAFSRGDIR